MPSSEEILVLKSCLKRLCTMCGKKNRFHLYFSFLITSSTRKLKSQVQKHRLLCLKAETFNGPISLCYINVHGTYSE